MATSYTTNCKLQKPAKSDRFWDVPVNANVDYLDSVNAIGAGAVSVTEIPSTTLHVNISAISYPSSKGLILSYPGVSSQLLTDNATNYLYLSDSGTLVINTTGFPAATFQYRLAVVVTSGGSVTSIADARLPGGSCGANRFSPAIGPATAGATYTSNEQTMLQTLWNKINGLV